jgi:hypothetical protein
VLRDKRLVADIANEDLTVENILSVIADGSVHVETPLHGSGPGADTLDHPSPAAGPAQEPSPRGARA